jgi:chromosomal replication initiation ATPase DnaA
MVRQLTLPLHGRVALGRADFIAAPANANALAFLERWPDWPSRAAAIHGPAGAGKTHLAAIWADIAGAAILSASELNADIATSPLHALVVEDIDASPSSIERDTALIALIDRRDVSLLFTAQSPPASWDVALADLSSRFAAIVSFAVWAPDDTLLAGLARKLFSDRQLTVSDQVIARIVAGLERTPAAIRDFIVRADAKALAERRSVTERLVVEMLGAPEP